MGFEIDQEDLQFADWPMALVSAIEQMRQEAEGVAVGPVKAAKLIVKHVLSLDPDAGTFVKIDARWASWATLDEAGRILEADGIERGNRLRTLIGNVLIRLRDWAKTSGGRTGQYRTYCQLCWRHALARRKFCYEHDPQINDSAYRKARRMLVQGVPVPEGASSRKNRLEKRNRLLDWLKNQRLVDQMGANEAWREVMEGKGSLVDWLEAYRPRVFERLCEVTTPNRLTVATILGALDKTPAGLPSKQMQQERIQLHSEISRDPEQLYGMLRRAEVCLAIEMSFKKTRPHGGARRGSGRRRRGSRKTQFIRSEEQH